MPPDPSPCKLHLPMTDVSPQPPEGGAFADEDVPSRTALSVELLDATRRLSPMDLAWLTNHISLCCKILRCVGGLRIRIVNDAEMAAAHEEFSGIPGTTDVLTFDLGTEPLAADEPADGAVLDTDILVCLDEAARQGAARGHTPARELLLYAVHGVLHCLGHDDHDEAAAARMHAEEDRVLSAVGVGPTYAAGLRTGNPSGGDA